MIKAVKPLAAGLVFSAFFLLTPGISRAQSKDYCYNHPGDNSHYCFCYHHPKECNGDYRRRYPDWNRRPDWNQHSEWDHHANGDYHHPYWNHGPEHVANAGVDHARDHTDHADFDHHDLHQADPAHPNMHAPDAHQGGHPDNGHGGHHDGQH